MDVLERILGKKIIAIIRGFKLDETLKTADAVAAGGLGLLEVPFDQRRPLAYTTDKIKALADRYQDGQVLVGAGTVLTVGQVRAAREAGAAYIITPTSREDVIKETKALGMTAMPGAMTPSEIEQCYRWGADIVKVFPSDHLGRGISGRCRDHCHIYPWPRWEAWTWIIYLTFLRPAPAVWGLAGI